jgi:hypothetical protein
MTTKEELYQKFGPKLIDALVQLILEQFNTLRVKNGLSELTGQQVLDSLADKLAQIPNYPWMDIKV